MGIQILGSMRGYKKEYLKSDLMAGIIIAALTIPISMGYAAIAGLPPVYGLYGSLLPTIAYALFSSSPQVVFGVDAAAAAITGSVVATAGIAANSEQALVFVPLMALLSGIILIIFSLLRFGKLMSYISQPVMGGFISGVALSLMFMQIPKMMGLSIASSEEIITLVVSIFQNAAFVNWAAVGMSCAAIAVIIFARKFYPRVPMPLLVLIMSIIMMSSGDIEYYAGVKVMGNVASGLPAFGFHLITPDDLVNFGGYGQVIYYAFLVAVVIMTESLLASNNFSLKNDYPLDDNQELFAFGMANLLAAFSGASPTSASVSRTAASDGFGGKTQLAPIVSSLIILGVLFLTPLLYHMPMPVLAAIVFCALTTVVEWDLGHHLRKTDRGEYIIFIASCLGVLLFGIIPGVIIGVVLSFGAMLRQASNPPRSCIGTVEGQQGYFAMARYPDAQPIPGVLMYRFSATLTFANARVFFDDIESRFTPDIKLVIIDASGIGAIDYTAAARIDKLARKIEATGARLYFANQIPSVNDELKKMGLERITEKPGKSREIEDVLAEFGINPYPHVEADDFKTMKAQLHCSFLKDNDACDYIARRHMKSGVAVTDAVAAPTAASGKGRRERPHSGPREELVACGPKPAMPGDLDACAPLQWTVEPEDAMPADLTPDEIIGWKIENLSYEVPEDPKERKQEKPDKPKGQPFGPDR